MINLGALEENFTGRRVMINDFGAGVPDVIGACAPCRDIAFLALARDADHARSCATMRGFAFAFASARAGVAGLVVGTGSFRRVFVAK